MHDALQSWRLDVQDTGALEELPKSMLEGDIFSAAYARAELQVAAPSADALHATHRYIAHRCDDTLTFDDVSTVFAYTQP